MQADQQRQHESWNVTIRARAHRKFDFTVKARNLTTTGKFQRFSLLLRLQSFIFRLDLESQPPVQIPRHQPGKTLKSKFLKILKKIRIRPWKKKTASAAKKDVKVDANPLKKLALKRTGKIKPFWILLTGSGLAAAAACWVFFNLDKYMNHESGCISRYASKALKFADSIANEILAQWHNL